MDDADTLAAMFYGDAPDLQQKQAAMAAALRRNQQQEDYGSVLAGLKEMNPALGDFGASGEHAAAQRQTQLMHAPAQGVDLQEGLMKLSQANRRNQALGDPTSPLYQAKSQLFKRLGIPVQEGMNLGDITPQEETTAERLQAREESLAQGKYGHAYDPATGKLFVYDTRTGKPINVDAPPVGANGAPLPRAGKGGASDDKELRDFEGRLSASGARAGQLGVDFARRANAQNLKTILQQPVNTPQMVAEATAALGRLITGGVVHEGTMEKMMPQTAGMAMQEKLQYIFGHPRDAGVNEFLQYMGHTADREDANAAERMKKERLGRSSPFEGLYKRNPEAMKRIAARYEVAPEELDALFSDAPTSATGGAGPKADQAVPAGAGQSKRPTRTVDGETRYWNGSAWVKE